MMKHILLVALLVGTATALGNDKALRGSVSTKLTTPAQLPLPPLPPPTEMRLSLIPCAPDGPTLASRKTYVPRPPSPFLATDP